MRLRLHYKTSKQTNKQIKKTPNVSTKTLSLNKQKQLLPEPSCSASTWGKCQEIQKRWCFHMTYCQTPVIVVFVVLYYLPSQTAMSLMGKWIPRKQGVIKLQMSGFLHFIQERESVCVCARTCVHACVCACMHICVCAETSGIQWPQFFIFPKRALHMFKVPGWKQGMHPWKYFVASIARCILQNISGILEYFFFPFFALPATFPGISQSEESCRLLLLPKCWCSCQMTWRQSNSSSSSSESLH